MNTLKTLSSIFEHRIIRIPDYQRGYAWQKHQLNDFWEDLIHLSPERVHYTGVLTLEPVVEACWKRWESDLWIIDGKGYKPFYIVDGQQRLTTSVILIQAILESVPKDAELNFQTIDEIRQQYILHTAPTGIRQSYLFGYEKDNPSDEFLRTGVFLEKSASNNDEQTFYTRNLATAKQFFKDKLKTLELTEIAEIYKKLTQKFKFNLYEVDDEIDVFVTFETMNNRGKPLSNLELLKNRLIYLSTLFPNHNGGIELRNNINATWKTIYEYLGRNPDKLLSDEEFLRNHWIMYFKFSRQTGNDYKEYLLDEKFTAQNVTHPKDTNDQLTVEEINNYVMNLQQAVKPWFYMHNPHYPLKDYSEESNRILVDRLVRLGYKSFKPLVLAAFCRGNDLKETNVLLKAIERYIFTIFTLSRRRGNTGDSNFLNKSRDYLTHKITTNGIVNDLNNWVERHFSANKFLEYIAENYELGRQGFYHWDGIRYFLFEYEQGLKAKGKQSTNKLDWNEFTTRMKDHVTLEHIYPQTDNDIYWASKFGNLNIQQKKLLLHSLGNLLPLSRSKNSSLQNDAFPLKKNNGAGLGYYNGSISENEVSIQDEWTPKEIFERGITLLEFMESRWNIILGDSRFKARLLHVAEIIGCLCVDDTEKAL
ncbi:DUF262 domain-containing protein [Acinetobacter pollinis]|uniref:DUF262 domain-containing protein n=1 Tax=Acinetobacter pollinis TaxID=2605270 RepID=A0ABU6DVR5_9GAMM|nr:DUF262 domain-containing protein [Acinetobacter pollinis]MEB5477561.1 DUF262 domain-containing protein [Acinetobacter pollinis]